MQLRFQPAYEFVTSTFAGFVRPAGHLHGLVLTHDANGRPITNPGGCFFNLEHYTVAGRCGLFAPRDIAPHSHAVGDDWVAITCGPTDDWPLSSTVRYMLREDDTIDIDWSFRFYAAMPRFEVFVASYMPAGTLPPLIKCNGDWTRPVIAPQSREQLFIPRDAIATSVVGDGRWDALLPRGFSYRLTPETYDLPIMMTTGPDGFAAPVLIQMVESAYCVALSPNRFAPAHDLSLLGIDVQPSTLIAVRARLVYRRLDQIDDAETLYSTFVQPAANTRHPLHKGEQDVADSTDAASTQVCRSHPR